MLVIGDTHEPFCLDDYLEHCVTIKNKYQCNRIIHIGDLIDNHYSSYHETVPDGMSAGDELQTAIDRVARWRKEFPKAVWIKGNHDALIERKAQSGNLSVKWIRAYTDVLNLPDWDLKERYVLDDVQYIHGMAGKASTKIGKDMMNTVQGHHHTEANITYKVGAKFKVWGMQVGCGINIKSYAMAYGKHYPKPAIGCGVVLENGRLPIVEMMEL